MIIDCVSDLHGFYPELEGGDLLIVAGDFCLRADSSSEQLEFISWMQKQKYKRIIFVAGNHDTWLQGVTHQFEFLSHLTYLCDSGTEFEYQVDQECIFCNTPRENSPWIKCSHTPICPHTIKKTVKIWGSPWTKTFKRMNPKYKAFTSDHDEEYEECTKHGRMFLKRDSLEYKWNLIPDDIDILVTHSPPYGILDETYDPVARLFKQCGSKSLLKRVCEIKPKLHVFGHIHEGYGEVLAEWQHPNTKFINASYVNEHYEPVNKPIRVIL